MDILSPALTDQVYLNGLFHFIIPKYSVYRKMGFETSERADAVKQECNF